MTLPLFLVPTLTDAAGTTRALKEFREGGVGQVSGPEADHARKVLRLGPGDLILLGDGAGTRVAAKIIPGEGLAVEIGASEAVPPPVPEITLVQALAKGGRDEQAVEMCTELGVSQVIPWEAERSVARWSGPKRERGHQKWVNLTRAAAKQSRRAYVPEILPWRNTKMLGAQVEGAAGRGARVFLCDEEADVALPTVLTEMPEIPASVWLIVGPEGGLSAADRKLLQEAGAESVSLGENVLRSSTAGAAALVMVSVLAGVPAKKQ